MTSDVVHVEIPGNRDDVLKILKRTGISGVPVIKNKKIVGIITRKDLLSKPEETQLGLLMTAKPVTIEPDMELREAARILITQRIRRLPVVEDGHLVGLLSVADVISGLAQLKIREEVKDKYTSRTFALWEETPLPVVGRVMEISGVDAIPILDAENKLQGIISERDLIRNSSIEDSVGVSDFSNGTDDDEWTWESIRDNHTISFGISRVQLPNRPVKLAMVKNVVAVPQNAEVSECALKMKRSRVDQLPVINGDKKLVSMLYDRELIRAMCHEGSE
ncbi:CBS domain-containing protein [uncultured Methanoregula sp.]|uniref:CBS domain-containing protein n=1 Tax=uncultured Methanoregula sp. TaxID=1005933 RepID=UPI002AAAEB7D|nr:CBS domain-containing protein [uncultured Methanoregula sp.]